MGFNQERRTPEFRHVCAIARVVLLSRPSMDDAEWKAATRDTLAKQGFEEPETGMLGRALNAVEQAVRKTIGPRATPELEPVTRAPSESEPPLTRAEWAAFADTLAQVVKRSAARLPSNVVRMARETLAINEADALDQFYREAEQDRLGALKRFAELAIVRPAEWDYAEIRTRSQEHYLRAGECFGCKASDRGLAWHHIIQIQFGGSNFLRNRVALCDACHAAIHPWLPPVLRVEKNGWYRLGSMKSIGEAAMEQRLKNRERA